MYRCPICKAFSTPEESKQGKCCARVEALQLKRAAAPDMYEALDIITGKWIRGETITATDVQQARAALNRATGMEG